MPENKPAEHAVNPSTFSDYVGKFDELKTVFDNLPDGIIAILDKDINIATANRAFAEMLKIPLEKIVGKKTIHIFEKRIPGLIEVLKESLKTRRGIRNYTIESVSPDGAIHSYLVSIVIIEEIEDSEVGMLLILHDVSEVTRLRKIALQVDRYGEMVGKSEKMKNIFALIESIKEFNTSVLLIGETGTGKELIARAIHQASHRKDKAFVPVNCSALPANLIESELFGHVKGAFTGANSNRPGRFKLADGGTLFLDEVGTLNLDTQVKLLRFLEEKIIDPLGSSKRIPVDVRIISASNRSLPELVKEGKFREDLYYRLKVLQIDLPPLRERAEDIPLLAGHFIKRLNRYYNKNIIGVSPTAKEIMLRYAWPGNIRELENAIEHAFITTGGALLEIKDFPTEIRHSDHSGAPPPPTGIDLRGEEETIKRALLSARGNRDHAAGILGIHRTTLWRKMREFRIHEDFGKSID